MAFMVEQDSKKVLQERDNLKTAKQFDGGASEKLLSNMS